MKVKTFLVIRYELPRRGRRPIRLLLGGSRNLLEITEQVLVQ